MRDWRRRLLIGVLVVGTPSAGCLGAPGGDRAASEEGATLTGDFTEAEFEAFLDEVAAANDETETFAFEMEIGAVNEALETTVPPDVRKAASEPDETTA